MAVRKVYGKVDGMAAQTVDVKAEMKAVRMDALKACEKVAKWVSSAQAAEMVVESE